MNFELLFNKENKKITVDGEEKKVSEAELNVLLFLVKNNGMVQSKSVITKVGWPSSIVSSNSLPVAITNLRKHLPKNSIVTHKDGYSFSACIQNKNESKQSKRSAIFICLTVYFVTMLSIIYFRTIDNEKFFYYLTNKTAVFSTDKPTLNLFCNEFNCNIKKGGLSVSKGRTVVLINTNSAFFSVDTIRHDAVKSLTTNKKEVVSKLLAKIEE